MVELAPGEIFIHTVNLKELFSCDLNTKYRIRGPFLSSPLKRIVIKER